MPNVQTLSIRKGTAKSFSGVVTDADGTAINIKNTTMTMEIKRYPHDDNDDSVLSLDSSGNGITIQDDGTVDNRGKYRIDFTVGDTAGLQLRINYYHYAIRVTYTSDLSYIVTEGTFRVYEDINDG
ncbi:MAG: hypothetical protein ACXAEN_25795 [Candidatus Thorarchaeota archaeon]|jgi:hypothetical protein